MGLFYPPPPSQAENHQSINIVQFVCIEISPTTDSPPQITLSVYEQPPLTVLPLPTNFPFSPHVGCQTPCTPTPLHVLRHGHSGQDQTATVPVFNYGFEGSNRAVAIATFKISQHSHPPPPTTQIEYDFGKYWKLWETQIVI